MVGEHVTTFHQLPPDQCKEDRRLGKIYFYQREIITKLFLNTTRGLFEKNSNRPLTYWHLIITEGKTKKPRSFKNLPRI